VKACAAPFRAETTSWADDVVSLAERNAPYAERFGTRVFRRGLRGADATWEVDRLENALAARVDAWAGEDEERRAVASATAALGGTRALKDLLRADARCAS
jgi:hypothetical protein